MGTAPLHELVIVHIVNSTNEGKRGIFKLAEGDF